MDMPAALLQTVRDKKLILDIGGSFRVDCSKGDMDPMTEGMVKMWGVFAEMERNIISQRVRFGMMNAAAKGKNIGRPETTKDRLPDRFWKYYSLYKDNQINISEFARIMDCSRTLSISISRLRRWTKFPSPPFYCSVRNGDIKYSV